MYAFNMKIYGEKNLVLGEVRYESPNNQLVINDEMYEIFINKSNIERENIIFWELYLVSKNLNLIVENYSVFDEVTIRKASDGEAEINILKSNVNLHLTNLEIDVVQVEDCNVLTGNCKINEFSYDIANYMKELSNKEIIRKKDKLKLDIRNSKIGDLNIYYSLDYFNVQNSNIKNIEFMSRKNEKSMVNRFSIWNGTKLALLRINCEIKDFNLEDSNIDRLYFAQNTLIENYTNKKSFIDHIFGCEKKNFSKISAQALEMIKKSSFRNNEKLYYEVAYELADMNRKRGLGSWFLKHSVGYGYKPSKAIRFIILMIIFFALLYSVVDILDLLLRGYVFSFDLKYLPSNICDFLDNIYFSGITFTTTGYGDITPSNFVVKLIAIIESCLGVAMFSLLIYSVTTRHLNEK